MDISIKNPTALSMYAVMKERGIWLSFGQQQLIQLWQWCRLANELKVVLLVFFWQKNLHWA